MFEYWCSAVRLLDQFTLPVRQLAPEHYLMKRIIKTDYSDLTQLWTFCYSREDTYIKIIASILDSASYLERLIQKIEWHFLRRPAIGAFTLYSTIIYYLQRFFISFFTLRRAWRKKICCIGKQNCWYRKRKTDYEI